MSIEDALKWADLFGSVNSAPPEKATPALTALAAEVRRLQAKDELNSAYMRRRAMNPKMGGEHQCEVELIKVKKSIAMLREALLTIYGGLPYVVTEAKDIARRALEETK